MLMITVFILALRTATLCEAASITKNIEDDIVCPGEELILTCISEGTYLRWTVMKFNDNVDDQSITLTRGERQMQTLQNYHFTLTFTTNNRLESNFSTVVTNALSNATVECADASLTPDTVTIRVEGEPAPPQNLSIISVEHNSNYSTVVVMWEPASNDSHVDFYQYQLIDSLTEVRASNTTNTTAILSDVPYNVNISFIISAYNCERESEQASLIINVDFVHSSSNFTETITTTVYTLLSTSSGAHTVVTPAKDSSILLFAIYVFLSTIGVFGMFIACLIVTVVFVRQVQKTKQELPSCQNFYAELEIPSPIYEMVGRPSNEFYVEAELNLSMNEDTSHSVQSEALSGPTDSEVVEENVTNNKIINLDIANSDVIYQNTSSQPQPCHNGCAYTITEQSVGTNRSDYDDFV